MTVGQSGRRPAAAKMMVGQSGRRPAAANRGAPDRRAMIGRFVGQIAIGELP